MASDFEGWLKPKPKRPAMGPFEEALKRIPVRPRMVDPLEYKHADPAVVGALLRSMRGRLRLALDLAHPDHDFCPGCQANMVEALSMPVPGAELN